MDNTKTAEFVNKMWDDSIIPEISEYIKVPNKSPAFDPNWNEHGHMETAVQMLEAWCKTQPIKDMTVEIVRIEGRTPVLFCEIPGDSDDVVVLYGHYDKQPEFSGWDEDLDPWTPVIKDGKLYGRGGADDGYAVFGSLTAIRALQDQHLQVTALQDFGFVEDHLGLYHKVVWSNVVNVEVEEVDGLAGRLVDRAQIATDDTGDHERAPPGRSRSTRQRLDSSTGSSPCSSRSWR